MGRVPVNAGHVNDDIDDITAELIGLCIHRGSMMRGGEGVCSRKVG